MRDQHISLYDRVSRLEREHRKASGRNHLLRLTLFVTLSLLAVTIFLGAGGGTELIVEKLTLVDGEGRVRALIGTLHEEGGVWLYDTAGMERASVTVRNEDAVIEIVDSAGLTRVLLATEGQELVFRLYDVAGTPLFSLP